MKSFNSKVAVITGAGSGIGRHLSIQMAEQGARVALADVSTKGLEETKLLIEEKGYEVFTFNVDVSKKDQVYQLCDDIIDQFKQVDLVINNAGVALGKLSVEEVSYEELEWIFGINLWGVIYGSKAFLPHLLERPEAYIVNISSVFGLIGIAHQAPYCTTKFAVRGFTESLKAELADTNVKAMSVHPGGIKTNIVRNSRGGFYDVENREQEILRMEEAFRTTPADAAKTIIKGIKKGKTRVKIGSDARMIDLVARLFPERSAYFMKKALEKLYDV